jgi:hypothetical protein
MKRLAIILVVLAASVCLGQTKAKDVPGAWIVSNADWTQDEFHKNERWTSAKVLFFFRDGRFGIVGGSVFQTGDRMEISYGDSQTVYFGSWKRTGAEIAVTYRNVYCDVCEIEKERVVQQETLAVNEDGEIAFHNLHFRKEPRLDKSAAFTISEKLPHGRFRDRQ